MKLEAKIDRMVQKGKLKAIASVSLDGMYVVKGFKVMDGRKGLFVSMPQESFSGKDGQKQYSNLFFGLTNSAALELQKVILDAYQLRMDPSYVPQQRGTQQGFPEHIQHQRDYYPQQYQRQYPEPDYSDAQHPEWLGDYDDILPMDIY